MPGGEGRESGAALAVQEGGLEDGPDPRGGAEEEQSLTGQTWKPEGLCESQL